MSFKFDSLMIILNKIDSGEGVTIQSLMDDLGFSQRSVFRYINTLQVAGYPIFYDRQKGEYAFSEGYTMKKPGLSVEESLALSLAKLVMSGFGSGIEKGLQGIEEKVSLRKPEVSKTFIFSPGVPPPDVIDHIGKIHQALTNFQRLKIRYKALYSNRENLRKVEPYYLFFEDSFWYLRGYCHLRKDLRTFALDRMVSLQTLEEHFIPRNISPEEELAGTFGPMVDGEPIEVVLLFDKEIKPYLQRRKWHPSQKEKEMKDGSLEMRLKVNGLEGIRPWIYRWLPWVKVVAPRELRTIVKQELESALKRQ